MIKTFFFTQQTETKLMLWYWFNNNFISITEFYALRASLPLSIFIMINGYKIE